MRKTIIALTLALPISALAQTAPAQQPPGQTQQMPPFPEVKARMLPMMSDSLAPMTETRDCVAASQNSEQINACVRIMADYQARVMASMGQGNNAQQPPAPPTLEWSQELKARILSDIDLSIKNTLSTKSCLEQSNSHPQMQQCMEAAGLARRQQ